MKILIGVWIAILILSACAAGSSNFTQEMDSLVGKGDKKFFVGKYGPPDKQATIDEGEEVWEFRLNEQKYTSPTGYRFSTFDRLRLSFSKGKLAGWSRTSITE